MHFNFLFAPAFQDWPIQIAHEIARRVPEATFSGLVTGAPHVFDHVKGETGGLDFVHLDRLDDLERGWLATPCDPDRLEHFEQVLGVGVIRKLVTADRQVGNGLVTGGLFPETELIRRCRDPETIRRYVLGLLEHVFGRLERTRPDLVFAYAVAAAPALAIALVSRHLGIRFIRMMHTRIGNLYVMDDTAEGLLGPVRRRFEEGLRDASTLAPWLPEARARLQEFRASLQPSATESHKTRVQRKSRKLKTMAREIASGLATEARFRLRPRPLDLRIPAPLERMRHLVRTGMKARGLVRAGPFRAVHGLPDAPFAYFPLHVDPEASTMVLAPMHTNQLAVVEALAKSLPLAMNLVVKEHEPMLGLRPPGFYDRLARMPGVVLASPFENGLELIRKARLTAVISGTAAWEAILLRRPALILGNSPFAAVGAGLVQCGDFTELPAAVAAALSIQPATEERLALFLAALLAESFEFSKDALWGKVDSTFVRNHRHFVDRIAERLISLAQAEAIDPQSTRPKLGMVSPGGNTP